MTFLFIIGSLVLICATTGNPITSIERDTFGVERSPLRMISHPILDKLIREDLHRNAQIDPMHTALCLLSNDFQSNQLLWNAWSLGLHTKPQLTSDPRKMAAFVYSMSAPPYEPIIYEVFNNAVTDFNCSLNYKDFHFKGLYALLLLTVQSYNQTLYRGISAEVDAKNDTFIRFNRFQSSSSNLTVALNYARKGHVSGTLMILIGKKNAAHITPFSIYPHEEEYLLEPQSQFRIVRVVEEFTSGANPSRIITLEQI